MSRSKQTRPRAIRAADRVREPREPKGADDASRARVVLRALKELGVEVSESPGTDKDNRAWSLPRIVESRPRSGYHHPASKSDVARVLRFFGEESVYGLQAVELRQGTPGEGLCLGRLIVPGRVVLFDQLPSPWRLRGAADQDLDRLRAAGSQIEALDGNAILVRWPGNSLKRFMLFDVLMHEVGHHLLQHHKGKRLARVARTSDHEASATAFARRCRAAFDVTEGGAA